MIRRALARLALPPRPAALSVRVAAGTVALLASVAVTVIGWSAAPERVRGTDVVVGLVGTILLAVDLVWLTGALPIALLASSATIGPALVDQPGRWRAIPVVVMLLLTELEAAGWSRELQSTAAPSPDVIALRVLTSVGVVGGGGALSYGLMSLTSLPSPSGLLAEAMAVGAIVAIAAVVGLGQREDEPDR